MRPWFTSRAEFDETADDGEERYVKDAVGYVVRASLLGFFALVGTIGAADPYWRTLPVLLVFAACLGLGAVASRLLFRREWHAAVQAYGHPGVHARQL